jgi:hypothetical protein
MGEWNENKLVGNSAENIIEYLINSMQDWECIKFGVENHIKDLRKAIRKEINPTTKKIKTMPDFVAFNEKTGETFFIEVKFRSKFIDFNTNKPAYRIDFLTQSKKYWPGTKLIILQDYEPYFWVVDLDRIKEGMCKMGKDFESYWDFEEIKEDIKNIFPELKDETIEEAIKKI